MSQDTMFICKDCLEIVDTGKEFLSRDRLDYFLNEHAGHSLVAHMEYSCQSDELEELYESCEDVTRGIDHEIAMNEAEQLN